MTRTAISLMILVMSSQPTGAQDLGPAAQLKPLAQGPPTVSDPVVLRQGGDTLDDAFVIDTLPFASTGTCVGYNPDYDWNCPTIAGPYGDVIYAYTPPEDQILDIDMCGTFADCFLHVFYLDDYPVLHACNDDYWMDDVCGEYVARIPDMPAAAGITYFIVVHGYHHTLEWYQISVTEFDPVATETRNWSNVKALFR